MPKQQPGGPAAILIPVCCILTVLLFFQQTIGYHRFESVKFPWVMGAVCLALFTTILIKELRAALANRRERVQARDTSQPDPRRFNPLWVVIATAIYIPVLPRLGFLAASWLYVLGLKFVLSRPTIRQATLDLAGVLALFLVGYQVLLIDLPTGPVEETLLAWLRAVV